MAEDDHGSKVRFWKITLKELLRIQCKWVQVNKGGGAKGVDPKLS